MMTTNNKHFTYKGYTGSIETSTEDMCLFGKVQMINDLVMYDAETLPDLKTSFESAVDEYLEMCEMEGKTPDKPCSGTFNIRMKPNEHRKCINEANKLGINLNSFINKCVNNYFSKQDLKEHFVIIDKQILERTFTERLELTAFNDVKINYDTDFVNPTEIKTFSYLDLMH